jgi:hypothetical protein
MDGVDLDINNYSVEDLFLLFNISHLDEETMKFAKKTVLKTHPDKSKLEPSYFLFYSQAYRRLFGIYEFQNKSKKTNKTQDTFFNQEKSDILDKLKFKTTKDFNTWFNKQFEEHSVSELNAEGYGDWLKSDDDICNVGSVSKADMADAFEKQKRITKSIIQYDGVNDSESRVFSGSILGKTSNYTSDTYSDLRQAYRESVIPVTEEDFVNAPKYNSLEEYNSSRTNIKPSDKEEAMNILKQNKQKEDNESISTAFFYAQQLEKSKERNNAFWSNLKQIEN